MLRTEVLGVLSSLCWSDGFISYSQNFLGRKKSLESCGIRTADLQQTVSLDFATYTEFINLWNSAISDGFLPGETREKI